MDSKTGNARIARNTLFLYGRMLFVLFISIYTTRVVMSALGITDYGIYNVVCGFVAMFSFLNTTLSNGIQRFYNFELGKNGSIRDVYCTAIILQALLAILVFVVIEPIGIWYVNNKMVIPIERLGAANWIFHLSVVSLLVLIIQIPFSSAVLAYEQMDYFALVSIIDVSLKLLIVLLLPYLSGDRLIVYGWLQLFIAFTNLLLYYIYSKRKFKHLYFSFPKNFSLFRSIFSFSGWNVLATFAWMTQNQGLSVILNLFFGPIVNAARGVSGQIQSAIQGFCENLVIAFRPQLVQSYAQGNLERTTKMMYSMSKIMFVFFFMLSLPVIIEIDQILHYWLGENVPQYTSEFTTLILVSMFPRNFVLAFAQVTHATGKIYKFQIATASVVLLLLPLSYIALRYEMNAISVYWLNIFVCVILFIVCLFLLKSIYPISILDYIKRIIIPCGVFSLLAPILPFFLHHVMGVSFIRVVIVAIVSLLICALLSLALIFNNEEKTLIKSFIPFVK